MKDTGTSNCSQCILDVLLVPILWKTLFTHWTLEIKIQKLITLVQWATITPIRKTKKTYFPALGVLILGNNSVCFVAKLKCKKVSKFMKLSCTIVWTFRFHEQQEKMKDLRNIDASSTHHRLKHIHSWGLLFLLHRLRKKVSCKHQAMGDVRHQIDGQEHNNFTQSLQNQSKIQDNNSPQLRQKVSFLQL